MAETDLYPPIKRFLEGQGYAVKGEIGACDIVALRGDDPPVIVEMKTAFSLKLVMQGVDRQAMSDAVYIAIRPPQRRQYWDVVRLCRRLGLGLLVVTGERVEPLADPAPYRPRKAPKRTAALLKEFARRTGDPQSGGTARGKRMTAYRQDALRCAFHLGENGATKAAKLRDATGVGRAAAILRDDVYGWFYRVERGIYGLTPAGETALVTYADALPSLVEKPAA